MTVRIVALMALVVWGCTDFNTAPSCGNGGETCCPNNYCWGGLVCASDRICRTPSVPPECGDGRCDGETCSTCPSDCGECLTADAGSPLDVFTPADRGIAPVFDVPRTCPMTCTTAVDCDPCRTSRDPAGVIYCCLSGLCISMTGTCPAITDGGMSDTPAATDAGMSDVSTANDNPVTTDIGVAVDRGVQTDTPRVDAPPPSCGIGEGEPCSMGTAAPNCCGGGRTCGNNGLVINACIAAEGAPCTRSEGCGAGVICSGGRCVPCVCGGRVCGPNNCGGGSCGTCAAGQTCTSSGVCQTPASWHVFGEATTPLFSTYWGQRFTVNAPTRLIGYGVVSASDTADVGILTEAAWTTYSSGGGPVGWVFHYNAMSATDQVVLATGTYYLGFRCRNVGRSCQFAFTLSDYY